MKKYLIAVAVVIVLAVAGLFVYERFGGGPGAIPTSDGAAAVAVGEQPPP